MLYMVYLVRGVMFQMRKRKFAGIVLLMVALFGSFASTVWALDRGIYDESNWQDWVGVRIDTIFSDWPYSVNAGRRFGAHNQCFMTARLIIYKVNEVDFNLQANGAREINLSPNQLKGVGSHAGKSVNDLVTLVGQRLGASNEEQVSAEFSKARVGDLVQFYRSSSNSKGEHTVIISGFYDDGIDVLHGGWYQTDTICNQKFTYAQFADWFEYSDAGFSIYRFGDPIPSGIPIDAEHFPDKAFRNCIHEAFDANGDWYLSDSEIENAKVFQYTEDKGFMSIDGIKYLTNLEWLYIPDNHIKHVDVSGLDKLGTLVLSGNEIESLNLAGCSSMTGLNLSYYKNLKELHINGCSSLEFVDAEQSPIANAVDTSGCSSLKDFNRASG